MAKFCSECGKAVEQNANFCIGCGAPLAGVTPAKPEWQAKRQKVLGGQLNSFTRNRKTWVILGAVALLGAWFFINLPASGNPIIMDSPVVTNPASYSLTGEWMNDVTVTVDKGSIVIPLNLVKEKKFVRFMYGNQDPGLPVLAYITNEGKVVTAISMCEPCNSTAFHIKGQDLICNSCGTTWNLNDLEAISGSCGRFPPDAVPNTVVGNEIRIDEQFVANWRRRV